MQKIKNIFSDPELAALLLWNISLVVFYQTESLRTTTLIWLFYFQNIFIGIQYYLRFRNLNKALTLEEKKVIIKKSGMKVTINGREVDSMEYNFATFFALHFGIFHAVYFMFIIFMTFLFLNSTFDMKYFLIGISFMALNTFFSTISHYKSDIESKSEDGYVEGLLKTPYMRVFPMHFFILLGFGLMVFLKEKMNVHLLFFIFLLFKAISDIWMYTYINKIWKRARPKAFEKFI